jgi:hypothetical protein
MWVTNVEEGDKDDEIKMLKSGKVLDPKFLVFRQM